MGPVINSTCMNVYVDERSRCIKLEWKGYGKDDEIIDVHTRALNLIKEKRLTKLIIDSLNSPTLNTNIQEWLNVEFARKYQEFKLKKMAVIIPQKITAKSVVDKMSHTEDSKKLQEATEMQFFNTSDDAEKWMEASF